MNIRLLLLALAAGGACAVDPVTGAIVAAVSTLAAWGTLFTVTEGNVGVVYKLGALQDDLYTPGGHVKCTYPLCTSAEISIIDDRDVVNKVECGLMTGVTSFWSKIIVVNSLPTNHVLEVLRRFTENYDPILIDGITRGCFIQQCATMTSDELFGKEFGSMNKDVLQCMKNKVPTCATGLPCIDIKGLVFPHPDLAKKLEDQYIDREAAVAENRTETVKQQVAKQAALTAEIKAHGEAKSQKIHDEKKTSTTIAAANATAYASRLASDAKTYGIAQEGKVTEQVIKNLQETLDPDKAFKLEFIKLYMSGVTEMAKSNNTKVMHTPGMEAAYHAMQSIGVMTD